MANELVAQATPEAVDTQPITPAPPMWALILLGRVQSGKPVDAAREMVGSRVSRDVIYSYGQRNPSWYQSLMDAQDGIVNATPIMPMDVARARAIPVIDHMADLAEGATHQRDQITAGRLVLEVAGAVGSQNQGAAATSITIQILGVTAQTVIERKAADGQAK